MPLVRFQLVGSVNPHFGRKQEKKIYQPDNIHQPSVLHPVLGRVEQSDPWGVPEESCLPSNH